MRLIRERTALTAQEVADKVAALLGEDSRTYVSIIQIERRGTNKADIQDALVAIYAPYGISPDEIKVACRQA